MVSSTCPGGQKCFRPDQPVCATLHLDQSASGQTRLVVVIFKWCVTIWSCSLPLSPWYISVPVSYFTSLNFLITIPLTSKSFSYPSPLCHPLTQHLTLLHPASLTHPKNQPSTHTSYLPTLQLHQHISLPNPRHTTLLHL